MRNLNSDIAAIPAEYHTVAGSHYNYFISTFCYYRTFVRNIFAYKDYLLGMDFAFRNIWNILTVNCHVPNQMVKIISTAVLLKLKLAVGDHEVSV